jgi:hypothetical protein
MCLYYRGRVDLLFFVDDGIFLGPRQSDIDEAHKVLTEPIMTKNSAEVLHRAFAMTDEGDLSDYLGVKIIEEWDYQGLAAAFDLKRLE